MSYNIVIWVTVQSQKTRYEEGKRQEKDKRQEKTMKTRHAKDKKKFGGRFCMKDLHEKLCLWQESARFDT